MAAEKQPFLTDIETIRARARQHIERGARTDASEVVRQDVDAGALEVVELAALQRAPEDRADQENERDGERDEEEEAFHAGSFALLTRNAFSTTMKELAVMPMAASSGPIRPAAASGSAIAL